MFMCVYRGTYLCMYVRSPALALAIIFPEPVAMLAASKSWGPVVNAPQC